MRDDDEPGSGSGLLWYEVGHSDGYYSGESHGLRQGKSRGYDAGWSDAVRQINARQENERRNGVRTIHINYYNSLINDLNQRGRDTARLQDEITKLDEEISSLNFSVRDLKWSIYTQNREIDQLRRDNAEKDKTVSDTEARLRQALRYGRGLDRYNLALLKAAEEGKTDRPEYEDLKEIIQIIRDNWIRNEPHVALPETDRLLELLSALER